MRLAIFDDLRLGVVSGDSLRITDVSAALPRPHDPDPVGAGWWIRLCRDFPLLRAAIEAAAAESVAKPIALVELRAPVLNPGKIVAAAVNYAAHAAEMRAAAAGPGPFAWLDRFDVFLKAPSSVIGPSDEVVLPAQPLAEGKEVHHESELAVIIGAGGSSIAEADALRHVLGYTIGLDMTVRGDGDRSRRKSYDTFTPLGPWLVTADEVGDPHALRITLSVGGETRQDVSTSDLMKGVPALVAYASSVMRLDPGDVILTGAPAGVAPVKPGDVMDTSITRIGRMRVRVRAA